MINPLLKNKINMTWGTCKTHFQRKKGIGRLMWPLSGSEAYAHLTVVSLSYMKPNTHENPQPSDFGAFNQS